jgi:hypothetical protein
MFGFIVLVIDNLLSLLVDVFVEEDRADGTNERKDRVDPNGVESVPLVSSVANCTEVEADRNSWVEDGAHAGNGVLSARSAVEHRAGCNVRARHDEAVNCLFTREQHRLVSLHHEEEHKHKSPEQLLEDSLCRVVLVVVVLVDDAITSDSNARLCADLSGGVVVASKAVLDDF